MHGKKSGHIFIIVVAFLLGLISGLWLSKNARIVRRILKCHQMIYRMTRPQTLKQETSTQQFLLVAVFVKTQELERKAGIFYNDFDSDTNINFLFFTTKRLVSLQNKTVVYLEGIGDSLPVIYLRMFRHVCHHYAAQFNWFMATESTFFVNFDKLNFLRNLNCAKEPLLITRRHLDVNGTSGTQGSIRVTTGYMDTSHIFQPGIVMSRSLVQKLSTMTEHCFNNINAFRKCFKSRVSWLKHYTEGNSTNVEMLNSITCRTQDRDLITKTITADLSQDLDCMCRLRVQLLSKRILALSKKYKELQHKLKTLKGFISSTVYDKIQEIRNASYKGFQQKEQFGLMFTLGKRFLINSKVPWSVHNHEHRGITRTITALMDTINEAHLEVIQFHDLYYGYLLNHPIRGLQYRMNIFTNKERHIASSRQDFGAVERRVLGESLKTSVNIVVPLAGRLDNFKQFMVNLENNILRKEPISMLVVYFPQTTAPTEHKKIFHKYNMTYKRSTFNWLDLPGGFARARALQAAVEYYKDKQLLFFADVDLNFNTEFLQRCRDNTVAKQQVYFPVMFKLFNPKIVSALNSSEYFRSFNQGVGDWARYSFGPVCAYRDDVVAIGGFNVRIKEWGYEDIHFFESFISRKYDVMRASDPGLLHIYHAHTKCDVIKNKIQRLMCAGAMLNGLASEESMVNYLLRKNQLKM